MLLAIDIGNTTLAIGLFEGARLRRRFFVPTRSRSYFAPLKRIIRSHRVTDTVICSVVPPATARLKDDLRALKVPRPLIIGKDIRVPLKNRYHNPREVGQDRLVNAYAALRLYGAPALVVDFGTAITFDVVSGAGEYLGGMILPGLCISLEALAEKTALLPMLDVAKPKEFIGRDTKTSMLSGVVYGAAAAADNLSLRIKKIIGSRALVIGTGGNIALIARYARVLDAIRPDLTLVGLWLLYGNVFDSRIKGGSHGRRREKKIPPFTPARRG